MIRKILTAFIALCTVILTITSLGNFVSAQGEFDFPFIEPGSDPISEDCDPTDLGCHVQPSFVDNLLEILGVKIISEYTGTAKFLQYVKVIINIALGLVSLVALIMIIYTFYMMFFTDHDAGAKKAKGNLIGIFITLAILGLSWLIVSFIFSRYQKNWESSTVNTQVNSTLTSSYDI